MAISAFLATGALGLGLAFSQMPSSAPAPDAGASVASAANAGSATLSAAPPAPLSAAPQTAQIRPQTTSQPASKTGPVLAQMGAPMLAPANGAAPAQAGATAAPGSEAGPRPSIAYSSAEVDGPYIALTFDDGPSPETTPKLLKILADRGIKATFFVLGTNATANAALLKRMASEGHEIGNHSWNHPQLTKISVAAADKQLEDTNAAIQSATGNKVSYLRPPYGSMNPTLRQHIEQKFGLTLVYWSVDPLDWKNRDAQSIYDKIMGQVRPGAIVLAHDIHATTVAAMPRVLDALTAKGYKFVTVSELIAMNKPGTAKVAALAPAAPRKKPKPARPAAAPGAVPAAMSAPAMSAPAMSAPAPRPPASTKRSAGSGSVGLF